MDIKVTKEMVYAFCNALGDGSITEQEFNEVEIGLKAAMCNLSVPADKPAVSVPEKLIYACTDPDDKTTMQSHARGWNECRAAMLAAAPPHSQQSALTIESAKPIWVHGYEAGHNDGIGCGHSLAPRCRHSGENEFYEEDIKLLIDRCPSHESEQSNNWIADEANKAKEQTKDWPEWKKDSVINSDAYAINQQTEGE